MNADFVDLLRALRAADVRFLIVGAYALAYFGRPRATGDLDVWVDATPSNAPRVMRALAAGSLIGRAELVRPTPLSAAAGNNGPVELDGPLAFARFPSLDVNFGSAQV